ncbi:MAG: hypothetical protein ACYDCN_15145 [Bacteroidia bacterium]
MKKSLLILSIAFAISAKAQENPKQKTDVGSKTELSYKSLEEKNKSIKEQEARFEINQNDPTYPKDALEKEKQTLEASKKATITNPKK